MTPTGLLMEGDFTRQLNECDIEGAQESHGLEKGFVESGTENIKIPNRDDDSRMAQYARGGGPSVQFTSSEWETKHL